MDRERHAAADVIFWCERRPGQIVTEKKVSRIAALIKDGDGESVTEAVGTCLRIGPPTPEMYTSYGAWLAENPV